MPLNIPTPETVAELQETMDPRTASRNTGPAPEGYVKCTEIAKFLNEALKAAGVDYKMRPQMVYGYARSGKLKTDNYPFVPEDEAQKFIDYHFARLTLDAAEVEELTDEQDNEDETIDEVVEA